MRPVWAGLVWLAALAMTAPLPAAAAGAGCLGVPLAICLQSLRATMRLDEGFLADALARRHPVDVNGRPLAGAGLVSLAGTLPGRYERFVILLHLAADDTVAAVESNLLADPSLARTERQYERTALFEIMSRLLGESCPGLTPLALYRFFENEVKPRTESRRVDVKGGLFGAHEVHRDAEGVPFCGARFSYSNLVQWRGGGDPNYGANLTSFTSIRLD